MALPRCPISSVVYFGCAILLLLVALYHALQYVSEVAFEAAEGEKAEEENENRDAGRIEDGGPVRFGATEQRPAESVQQPGERIEEESGPVGFGNRARRVPDRAGIQQKLRQD